MEPITIAVSLELGSLILAAVGAVGAWVHHRHQKALHRQRERHHRETHELQQRIHRERLAALDGTEPAKGGNGRAYVAPRELAETAGARASHRTG